MQADPKFANSDSFVAPAEPRVLSEPMTLGDRIKKALGIAKSSDLIAEGDEPYLGF